eukprot:UN12247
MEPQLSVDAVSDHQRDISTTVVRHKSEESYISDEEETVNTSHRREISEVFNYDTSTLNKSFQKEIADVFAQFQDELHEKQNKINEQKKINKQLSMEISKLQLNMQEVKRDRKQWRSKTINSVKDMVSQQNTDMVLDDMTQQFELDSTPKTLLELTQKIKLKYAANTANIANIASSNCPMKYLLTFGKGVAIGYVFQDQIKAVSKTTINCFL